MAARQAITLVYRHFPYRLSRGCVGALPCKRQGKGLLKKNSGLLSISTVRLINSQPASPSAAIVRTKASRTCRRVLLLDSISFRQFLREQEKGDIGIMGYPAGLIDLAELQTHGYTQNY